MKRFYKSATIAEAEGGAWDVRLDGRPVLTPGRARLALPSRALAELIAAEWSAQAETVQPARMPAMQLAATALDRVAPAVGTFVDALIRYAETDLVCYRAEGPEELAEREHCLWQPLLDWAALRYDAPLAVTRGIVAVEQPRSSLDALRRAVEELEPLRLTALQVAVGATGSLVIGLALLERHIDAEAAFEAAMLDETYQIGRWGEDPEAARRRAQVAEDLRAAERVLLALDDEGA